MNKASDKMATQEQGREGEDDRREDGETTLPQPGIRTAQERGRWHLLEEGFIRQWMM